MFDRTHFRLHQLNSSTQDKLIWKWQEGAWDFFDSDNLTDYFRQELEPLGYPTDKIRWSLGYSPGDGVAFYGPVNLKVVFERVVPDDHPIRLRVMMYGELDPFEYLTCELTGDWGHYHHWNSMSVNMDWRGTAELDEDDERFLEDLAQALEPHIKSDVGKISRQLERDGYNEIEHVSGAEAAREALAENWYNEYGEEIDPPDSIPLSKVQTLCVKHLRTRLKRPNRIDKALERSLGLDKKQYEEKKYG